MSARRPAFRGPMYEVSLKDVEGYPTVVVAGPDREHVWLYAHDSTPTVLRLRRSVVRFLLDALSEVNTWFDQPERQRRELAWTLPRQTLSAECVLIATGRRAWLQVFAASPSVVRLNERTVQFLLYVLADLPRHEFNCGYRWTNASISGDLTELGQGRR